MQSEVDLRYWNNGRNLPLPSWGKFYLQLGAEVAKEDHAEEKLVAALAVPTRAYAAVLVGAGAIIFNGRTDNSKGQASPTAHFDMLTSLPVGTAVVLRRGEREIKGIFVGTKDFENDGRVSVGVQIQSERGGSLTEWLPKESSLRVQVSSATWTRLPADLDKAKDVKTSGTEFIRHVLQGADLWYFVTESALNCVILGNVGPIVQEATTTKLSVGSRGRESSAGTLQDILRIRRLYKNNEAFRSDIFPVNSRNNNTQFEESAHPLVVFDGASGFLKWRDRWADCNWVVILDRTETRFSEAVQVVNEEYLSRVTEGILSSLSPPPKSVELTAFTVIR